MSDTPSPALRDRRHGLRLTLWMMLLVVALFALVLGRWVAVARAQRRAVELVERASGGVAYDDELASTNLTDLALDRSFSARLGASGVKEPSFVLPPGVSPTAGGMATGGSNVRRWLRRNLGPDYVGDVVQVVAVETELGDADMPTLAALPGLEELNLGMTSVGDEGLSHLAGLRRLRVLYLSHTNITDDGLATLGRMRQLEELNVAHNPRVTDAGLKRLSGLSNLRVLELIGTGVTDDGLRTLKGLPSLKVLVIGRQPGITREVVEELKSAMPGVKIAAY